MAGPGRIQFAEIKSYAELQGFGLVKLQDFLFYVEAMDEKFMEIAKKIQEEEERKNQQNGGKPGGKPGPRR